MSLQSPPLKQTTKDQDANRAKVALELFAVEKGLNIVGVYTENISGTKLNRPELRNFGGGQELAGTITVESHGSLTPPFTAVQDDSHSVWAGHFQGLAKSH